MMDLTMIVSTNICLSYLKPLAWQEYPKGNIRTALIQCFYVSTRMGHVKNLRKHNGSCDESPIHKKSNFIGNIYMNKA